MVILLVKKFREGDFFFTKILPRMPTVQGIHRGLLLHEAGYVLKPVQAAPKGEREVQFYQHISTSPRQVDTEFYSFIPKVNKNWQFCIFIIFFFNVFLIMPKTFFFNTGPPTKP